MIILEAIILLVLITFLPILLLVGIDKWASQSHTVDNNLVEFVFYDIDNDKIVVPKAGTEFYNPRNYVYLGEL